jgi:hypothetical protein
VYCRAIGTGTVVLTLVPEGQLFADVSIKNEDVGVCAAENGFRCKAQTPSKSQKNASLLILLVFIPACARPKGSI